MEGVVNINKPSGMTSHDVVLHVRRILREKRIGHTGTLDPLATGVLVLCIGKATRIAQYLEAGEKEYAAVMRLGITTDTLDADGLVLETKTCPAPTRELILRLMRHYIGTIMQRPPAFSAVKISGVPSYKLARQGKTEPNKPRAVTINALELTAYEYPFVSITVRCSKGVYIRSLCADLGDALGTGAHVTKLQRTRSGRFRIADAVTLEELSDMAEAGREGQAVATIDDALADVPPILLAGAESERVTHGSKVSCPYQPGTGGWNGLVRLHDPLGRLLALARLEEGIIRPELVFSAGS
jgi:tRNA pseudouridine55 synthase